MCHFQRGTTQDVALVLSCPGKHEKEAGSPAAKTTGSNISKLLSILQSKPELPFLNLSKDDLRITNSWSQVEYKSLTGRSEANFDEILSKENLDRLYEEIKDIKKVILCCGDRAKVALLALQYATKINKEVKVIFIEHLGMRAINRIKQDIEGHEIKGTDKSENMRKRLEVIADKIEQQYI